MEHIKSYFFIGLFFACFFLSENSNAQKINQFNSNNERVGVWKKYYPNKKIRYEGQFENGKEIGVFKFYNVTASENPEIVKTFYSNSDSLLVQFYSTKGILESQGIIKRKQREGKWNYFFANGKIMSVENYKQGKLHGTQKVFYPNGKTTSISNYANGLLEGLSSKYASDGVKIEEITYQNDKPNGVAKFFELNGNLKETGTYKNGQRLGDWEYYIDGKFNSDKEDKKTFTPKIEK